VKILSSSYKIMEDKVAIIKNLVIYNNYKKEDIKPGQDVQCHNGQEAVHIKILRIDPKNTGKFIGKLTTYFIKHAAGLKKDDLVLAGVENIYLIR